jgi:glutamyl-tRNA reductase
MVLSTCNRTEIYFSAEDWVSGPELFADLMRALHGLELGAALGQVYDLRGADAVVHLFRVAASLDSLVVGEPQILGQTKAAFRAAESAGCVQRDLQHWIPKAFAAAKRVRSETAICESAVSVSHAAVQLGQKIFGDLAGKRVVLIGAGRMGELAALHLRDAGAGTIVVANRTLARGQELAGRCGGEAVDFASRGDQTASADVVVCSTDAPEYVLGLEDLRRRPRRPLLVLDISVPRNVDPRVAELEEVYLFNIDDLERVAEANRSARRAEAAAADTIVQHAAARFLRETEQTRLAPTIAAVRNQVRSICRDELDRLTQKIPDLSSEDRAELELMLHRIAQKIVHPVIVELKASANPDGAEARVGLVERFFGIAHEATTGVRPVGA